jgi:hypothetical protein
MAVDANYGMPNCTKSLNKISSKTPNKLRFLPDYVC